MATLLTINDPPPFEAGNYFEKLNSWASELNLNTTEITEGRGIYASLNARFEIINGQFSQYTTTTEMQTYVNGQIASGGVDWSTFGNPNDVLTLNGTGDAPIGVDPSVFQTDWTTKGSPNQVIQITSGGDDVEGKTFPNDFTFDNSNMSWSNLGTEGQILSVNGSGNITAIDKSAATGLEYFEDTTILIPTDYTYIQDALDFLKGKTWSKNIKVTIKLDSGTYTPSIAETTKGFLIWEGKGDITIEGQLPKTASYTSQLFVNESTNHYSLVVDDASPFSVGDIVKFKNFTNSAALLNYIYGIRQKPPLEITDITGNKITFDFGLALTSTTTSGSIILHNTVINDLNFASIFGYVSLHNLEINPKSGDKLFFNGDFIFGNVVCNNINITDDIEIRTNNKVYLSSDYVGYDTIIYGSGHVDTVTCCTISMYGEGFFNFGSNDEWHCAASLFNLRYRNSYSKSIYHSQIQYNVALDGNLILDDTFPYHQPTI